MMRMTLQRVRSIFSPVDRTSASRLHALTPVPDPRLGTPGLPGVRAILEAGLYWSVYEPLVEVSSMETVAFEALARFRRPDGAPMNTASMFALLHADPS